MEKLLGNNIPYNTTNNKDISNTEYSDFTQLLTDPNMLPAVLASINSKEQADVIATYVNNNFISISEIAKIIQKTTQATVSMIKTNEKTFPVPINIANTNLYNKKSTMNWLINHNKIRRDTDEMINEEFLYGVIKTAVLVGGPGCGKSTLSTGFAEETLVPILRKIFSAGGSADTENTIKIHLKKTTANYVVFHYFDDCQTVPIAITEDNIKRIIAELDKCKKSANLYREEKTQEGEAKLTRTYVELVLTPNQTIMEMMTKHNIDVLTIVDTPGIDSKHIGENISSADIMIVVLGDRQNMEWIANNIKENVIPCSATAKYLYLYNNRYYLGAEGLTEEECQNTHDEYFEDAKHDLKDYEEGLKELQDESVIGSTLSACKPLQSLLCVPVFDIKKRPNKNEIFFFKQLADKMSNTFENSLYAEELNAFKVDEAGEFFLEIMEVNINKDKILKRVSATTKYTINDFCNEKHGRTKSLDDYSIEESYTSVLSTLKQQVYEEFKKYKTVDCNDIEMSAIRLAFLTINEGLMNKVHFGKGTHPWEDIDSPTQMICEEILSQQITKGCIDKEKTISEYIEVMKKNGVSSGSWNFVELEDTDWNRAKILINVNYGFTNLPANNLEDMIKWCHFLPAILIQSVLSYYKLQNHEWKESDFSTMYDTVMKRIYK